MSLYKGDMESRLMAGEKMEDVLKNPDAPKTNWAELSKNLLNNQGFPNTYNVNLTKPYVEKPPVVNAPSLPTKGKESLLKKISGSYNKNLIIAVVLIGGYFAYKKFKK